MRTPFLATTFTFDSCFVRFYLDIVNGQIEFVRQVGGKMWMFGVTTIRDVLSCDSVSMVELGTFGFSWDVVSGGSLLLMLSFSSM